jgi:hypothetical protein
VRWRAQGWGGEKQGWGRRRGRGLSGLGMEKEARDKGAQEESRRAHGVGRRKETQVEGGAKEEEEGWEWKRKRGTRVLRRKAGETTGERRKTERQDRGWGRIRVGGLWIGIEQRKEREGSF